MAKRDVELIIRARNEAGRAINSITGALRELTQAQESAQESALGTDATIGKLGAGLRSLERIMQQSGSKAGRSFSQVEAAVDRASESLSKQKARLNETRAQYDALVGQLARAKEALSGLRLNVFEEFQAGRGDSAGPLQERMRATKAAYDELTSEVERLRGAMAAQEREVDQSSAEFNKLQGAATAAQIAMRGLEDANTEAAATAHQVGRQMKRAETDVRGASAAIGTATQRTHGLRGAMSALYGESRRAMSFMQRLRGEVLSLAAANLGLYQAINQVQEIIQTTITFESAWNRLGVVFEQNSTRIGAEMNWLVEQALRLGVEFETLADQYTQYAFAAREAGFTNDETRQTFIGLIEAGRVLNLSNDQLRGTFYAVIQMLSKGKVQSEELRRQLGDRLTGAFQLFASAIGVSTQELDRMLDQGEVIANRRNLVRFAETLADRFGDQLPEALQSTTAEMGRLSTVIQLIRLRMSERGFGDAFRDMLQELQTWLQSDDGERFFDSIGNALTRVTQAIPGLIQNLDVLVRLLQLFAAIKISQIFLGFTRGLGAMSGSLMATKRQVVSMIASLNMMAASASGPVRNALHAVAGTMRTARGATIALTASLRGLWAAMGGLPGLIVSVIAFVATDLLGQWFTAVDRTSSALEQHETLLSRVRSAYVEARGEVENWADALEGLTRSEIELNNRDLVRNRRQAGIDMSSAFSDAMGGLGIINYSRSLEVLIGQFRRGQITGAEFREELDRMIQGGANIGEDLQRSLFAAADAAETAERAMAENGAALRMLEGTATDADLALLGLAGALEEVDENADTGALDEYTRALRGLQDAVPELRRQNEFEESLAEINRQYEVMIARAEEIGDSSLIRQAGLARDEAVSALNRSFLDSIDYRGLGDRIAMSESGGRADARNPNSSATGLGQFIESTWLELFRQHFPDRAESMTDAAILALRESETESRALIELYLRENARYLQEAGAAVSETSLYLAHFLGPQGAARVLEDMDAPLSQTVSPAAIAANPDVLGGDRTGRDLVEWARQRVGQSEAEIDALQTIEDIERRRSERQRDFNRSLANNVEQRNFEASILNESEREQRILTSLFEAERRAREDNVVLTDAQREAIRTSVGAAFDLEQQFNAVREIDEARLELANARGEVETREAFIVREARESGIDLLSEEGRRWAEIKGLIYDITAAERQRGQVDERVSLLREQRDLLMEQIEFYREIGEFGTADVLREQLEAINAQLLAAIDNAIAMWSALDTPEAANALLRLQTLRANVENLNSDLVITAERVNENLADGITNAFDRFAQAVGRGEDAVRALGAAFLQFAADFLREIAMMILRQQMLNLLQAIGGGSGGIGGKIAGFVNKAAGVLHGGGIAGSESQHRSVPAMWFANAERYHGGGIAGLKPGEVPAILKRGEEVLTEDNPRHVANGGGGVPAVNAKIVNVLNPADLLSQALSDEEGQRVLVNYIRANSGAFNAALNG